MMLNLAKKLIPLGFLAAVSATSFAQQAEFYLAYGDGPWAALNGAQIGDKIDALKYIDVTGLSTIRVRVMAKSIQDSSHGVAGTMLAFDTANTTNQGSYGNLAAFNQATTNKVFTLSSVTNNVDYFLPTGLPGLDANNNAITVDASLLGNVELAGVGYPTGTSTRPVGLWCALAYGLGKELSTKAGQAVPLIEYKINVNQSVLLLNFGGIFGKSESESGLTLFGHPAATTRKTYLGLVGGQFQATTIKLRVRNIEGVNLPTANPDEYSLTEDTTITVPDANGVVSNDVPIKVGDTLTAVLDTTTQHGTLTFSANGGFTYLPAADFNGIDQFVYHVKDQNGFNSPTATCKINVASVNDPPVVTNASFTTKELEFASKQLTFDDSKDNPQNLPLKATLVSGPAGLAVSESGTVSWTPTEAQGPGDYNFDVLVTDSGAAPNSSALHVTWHVNEVNVAPTLDAFAQINANVGDTVTAVAVGHDTDLPAQTLAYTFVSKGHPDATLNAINGQFEWFIPTTAANNQTYAFVIKVTDALGATATQQLNVLVGNPNNQPPVLEAIGNKSAFVDTLLSFTAHANDPNGNAIEYSLLNAPLGATVNSVTGQFAWTPTLSQLGTHTMTIVATEQTSDRLSDSETFTIEVTQADSQANFYLAYGDADWAALNGAQVGDAISRTKPAFVQGLTKIRVRLMVSAKSNSTHAAGGLMVCFDQGIASGTQNFASLSAFNQTTTEKVLTMGGIVSGTDYFLGTNLPGKTNAGADTPVNVELLGTLGLSGSFGSGITNRPLGLWIPIGFGLGKNLYLTQNVPVALAEYSLNIDHAQLLVKYGGIFGNDADETGITIFASRNAGSRSTYLGATTGNYQGAMSKIAISSVGGGSAPTAVDDAYATDEDTNLTVNAANGLLKNDTDPDAGDKLYAVIVSQPAHGTVQLASDGSFVYHPQQNSNGTDTFKYKAADAFGNLSNEATVTISVASVNDAPVVSPYLGGQIKEMELFTYQLAYSDPNDNPENTPITIEMVSGPTGMTISSSGLISWTPTEEQGPQNHTVVVKATDSLGASSTTSMIIPVIEANLPPELSPYSDLTVQAGDLVVLPSHGSDPDRPAQTLTYSLIGNSTSATINALSGEFRWQIPANQAQGAREFFVRVVDSFGVAANATLKIIVGDAVNDPPVLDPIGNRDIRVNQLLKIKLHAVDPENDPLKYTMSPIPTGATLDPNTGQFSWRPKAGQEGDYDITFKVAEDITNGLEDTETVHITVGSPVAVVAGLVELRDFAGDVTKETLTVEVRTPLGQLVETKTGVEIGRYGVFEFYTAQTGKFVVSVKGRTWLAQMRYPMTLNLTDPAKAQFHLYNGDCNGDNIVDASDLLMIQNAFNTQVGDAAYDRRADLNGDGKVDGKDQAICTKNQKLSGY